MLEENLLFVENKLNRWKRPESPRPGTAFVFVGDGKPSLVVYEGERGPTQGELLWGKYSTYYEVDLGDRSLEFDEKLPCSDAFEFQAEVRLTYKVSDPAVIVRRARTDAGQSLKYLAIDVMRRTSRRYTHEQSGEAENAIASRIEEEVRDNGFKLSSPAFVKLSLDEKVRTLLTNRKLGEYNFQDDQTEISRKATLDELKQTAKLSLKGKRAEIFAPLIKSGDWATLLAMLDPCDPEDQGIKEMIDATLFQQKMLAEKQQKMLEIAIEKGAIEGWQLEEVAKDLFKEVVGLSEGSVAFLEGKSDSQNTEDIQQVEEIKPSVPDEISRSEDD